MDSYLLVMSEIHILLVDHESPQLVVNTIALLQTCCYKVTHEEFATNAIRMLLNEKLKFNFIIVNENSPDNQSFELLRVAAAVNIPTIMMSSGVNIDDMFMATEAMKYGAFLYIKRPTTVETMRCLWQHVARDNMREMREHERMMANYGPPRGMEMGYEGLNDNQLMAMMMMKKEKGKLKRNYDKGRGAVDEDDYDSDQNRTSHGKVKRKICTEWTHDLHLKFIDAVQQLGEGRCFPKEILELMDVPGLTRMQVASHLQKCRNDNWRSPDERKCSSGGGGGLSSQAGDSGSNQKLRRFGSMPRIVKEYHVGQSSKSNAGSGMGNNQMETMMPAANQPPTFHHQYGAVLPHPHAPNPAPAPAPAPADDMLSFQDMGCLIQTGLPPSINDNIPHSASADFHFVPVYTTHDQANSKGESTEKSEWPTSSETSNFCSGDSEAKTS